MAPRRRWRDRKRCGRSDDITSVSVPWVKSCADRLIRGANSDGGWGYRSGCVTAAEPTALACLALSAHRVDSSALLQALRRLADLQRPDGGVPVSTGLATPCWTTGLAVLAWRHAGDGGDAGIQSRMDSAVSWLLEDAGIAVKNDPPLLGHDTHLIGWSWAPETHSWVEPTAYAILALRSIGRGDHARVREGVRLLLDRSVADGGWNYGNPLVMGRRLRPFPAATGIALAALCGEPRDDRIERAVDYLADMAATLRAPMSLAWAIIGLSAWSARPAGVDRLLAHAAGRTTGQSNSHLHDALLLLAGAEHCPLIPAAGAQHDA